MLLHSEFSKLHRLARKVEPSMEAGHADDDLHSIASDCDDEEPRIAEKAQFKAEDDAQIAEKAQLKRINKNNSKKQRRSKRKAQLNAAGDARNVEDAQLKLHHAHHAHQKRYRHVLEELRESMEGTGEFVFVVRFDFLALVDISVSAQLQDNEDAARIAEKAQLKAHEDARIAEKA